MRLKPTFAILALGLTLFGLTAVFAPSEQAFACTYPTGTTGPNGESTTASEFFGLRNWHHYLPCDDTGAIDNTNLTLNSVWLIAIAVFETLLRVGALLALAFIIWGGVKYITSQGNADGTASARKTIINSIAGLLITISASVMVSFAINLLSGGNLGSSGTQLEIPNSAADGTVITSVLRLVYAVVAVVSVIYIVIGSIKFATSTGDPGKAANARNTIIYAIVGLLVVLTAQMITNVLLEQVDRGATSIQLISEATR